jgi:1,2-phenylacetyl-CoA epoxidase catalytic subunit
VQRALDFWFPKVNKVFGKQGSKTNQEFQRFHIKQRDNHEVRVSWYEEIKPLLESYGLVTPAIDLIEHEVPEAAMATSR